MFKDTAAPTRANIRKRLMAAEEALNSASALIQQRKHHKDLGEAVVAAASWNAHAKRILAADKGKGL